MEEPLRQEGKRVCPPPQPPHPPKVIAVLPKCSWNSNSSQYYLILQPTGVLHGKKIAGDWKLKAGTYNKAKGWHCQPAVPSDYSDWRKPLPGSFHGRERVQAADLMDIPLEKPPPTAQKSLVKSYPFNPERGRSAELPIAGCSVGGKPSPRRGLLRLVRLSPSATAGRHRSLTGALETLSTKITSTLWASLILWKPAPVSPLNGFRAWEPVTMSTE